MLRSTGPVADPVASSAWRLAPCRSAAGMLATALLLVSALASVAAVTLAMVWMPGHAPALAPWLYMAGVTPWLVLIDLRVRRLPNKLVLPGFAVWVLGVAWGVLADPDVGWARALASLAVGGAYALVLGALAWWGGMGGGDLKLGTLLGLMLGLVSPPAAAVALPLAFLAGAVVAVVVLAASPKGERRGRSIPFGPCLLLGAAVALAGGLLLASQQ